VGHQRNSSLIEPGREQLYVTDGYVNHQAASWWALRTDGDPALLPAPSASSAPGRQGDIDQRNAADGLTGIEAQAQTRFSLLLIGVFSTIAALLPVLVCMECWRLRFASELQRSECEWPWARRRRASFV
jgi:putative ABC transport system permease protein